MNARTRWLMSTALRIPQFAEAHSRGELDKLTKKGSVWPWVRVPTRMDGEGYRGLMLRPGGVAAFGVYILMVEVAANLPVKGLLADEKGPLTTTRLAVKTSAPVAEIETAIELLTDPDIGWLVPVEIDESGSPIQANHKPTTDQPEGQSDGSRLDQTPRQTVQNNGQMALEEEVEEEVEEEKEFLLQSSNGRKRDPLFDAVALADRIKPGTSIPPNTAKRIGSIVAELRAKGAKPDQVGPRWAWIIDQYPGATVHAIAKHWDTAGRGLESGQSTAPRRHSLRPEVNATPADREVGTW